MNLALASLITLSVPLVLAALGGLTSERAGVMNIGLEGKLLAAACATAVVAVQSGNAVLGLLAGVAAAVVLSLTHAVLTQSFRLDHIISGMALNALALGGTNVVAKAVIDQERSLEGAYLPVGFYWAAAAVAVVAVAVYLARVRGGQWLLAVGNDPDKSRQMGLDPVRVRYGALVATGVLCGLGGALIASNAGSFTDGMTAGRGFIALAALILGGWRPLPTLLACLVFGGVEAAQLQLQGTPVFGAQLPSEFWGALPYLATLVAMVGLLGKTKAPAGLGRA